MKYFLLRRQKGEGCDYTIGCGLSFEEIRASSREEALQKVIDLPNDWKEITDEDELHDVIYESGIADVKPGEFEMKEITLFEVVAAIDLVPILKQKLAEYEEHQAQIQNKRLEESERLQYEKLKKKFDKK